MSEVVASSADEDAFFATLSAPDGLDLAGMADAVKAFVARNASRRLAVVTSGGTAVQLEANAVRFIDNFSRGTRGAASAEVLLSLDYAVVFLSRSGSKRPLHRRVEADGLGVLDLLGLGRDGAVAVKQDSNGKVAEALRDYQKVLTNGQLLELSFTTLAEYMWALRATCAAVREAGSEADGRSALFFLAAAVSDFYVSRSDLPTHKLQSSEGAPTLPLRVVPKMLLRLVREWAPRRAFVVTFKLETDEAVLMGKARKALRNYGHHLVVANLLSTRRTRVILVTSASDENNDDETVDVDDRTTEIESVFVANIAQRHAAYIDATL